MLIRGRCRLKILGSWRRNLRRGKKVNMFIVILMFGLISFVLGISGIMIHVLIVIKLLFLILSVNIA